MPKTPKFPIFEGPGAPLNVNIFQKSFTQVVFHELTQIEGSDTKLSKVDKIWTTLFFSNVR